MGFGKWTVLADVARGHRGSQVYGRFAFGYVRCAPEDQGPKRGEGGGKEAMPSSK